MPETREQYETALAKTIDPDERFTLLCELVDLLMPVDLAAATERALEACALVPQISRPEEESLALDVLGECYARSGHYEKAIEAMERSIPLYEKTGNLHRAIIINTNIGNTHWFAGEHQKALDRFAESRRRTLLIEDQSHLAIVTNNTGTALIYLGRLDEAEEQIIESLQLNEELDDRQMVAANRHSLGRIYCERHDYRRGLATLQQSLQNFTDLEYPPGISAVSLTIGHCHDSLGNEAAALEAYHRSIAISRTIGDRKTEAAVLNNVGTLYHNDHRLDEAAEHFRLSLAIKEELGNRREIAHSLLNLARIALEKKKTEEATGLYAQVAAIADEEEAPYLVVNVLLGRLRIAREQNGSADEITALLEATHRTLRTIENFRRHGLATGLGAIEIEAGRPEEAIATLAPVLQQATESAQQELQQRAHGLLARAYRAIGDLAEAFDHLVAEQKIERVLVRRSADNRLESQMAIYEVDRARSEGALARKEAEVLRLEKGRLEQEAEHRRRELLSTAMFLSQKNDFLRTLHRRLSSLEATDQLQSITDEIDGIVETEDSWDRFEQEFRKVHGNYLQIIAARFPKLTPTELKVCALVRTGLSTKEIARILIAEPRSIDKYRQRIRKKIALPSADNLQVFLQGISEADQADIADTTSDSAASADPAE